MEIVSSVIKIKIDDLAVSAGSGPSEMSLESLETSIIVMIDTFFFLEALDQALGRLGSFGSVYRWTIFKCCRWMRR